MRIVTRKVLCTNPTRADLSELLWMMVRTVVWRKRTSNATSFLMLCVFGRVLRKEDTRIGRSLYPYINMDIGELLGSRRWNMVKVK